MALKLTDAQKEIISRMEEGFANIREPNSAERVNVRPNTVEYSRDGLAIVASRVVRRDGRSGEDGRLDWRTECYRIQKDGTVSRL